MKIAWLRNDETACTYYRSELPMKFLNKHDVPTIDVCGWRSPEQKTAILEQADIIQIGRPVDPLLLQICQQLQADGKKIVVDFDDNVFDVSPYSAHYEEWGLKNIAIELNGQTRKLWEDGVNIDFKANAERLYIVSEFCKMADMVTVTTPIIADVYHGFNNNVVALNNCVDMARWQKADFRRNKDEIRLFWAGGASHYEDWYLLKDVLPEICRRFPQVKIVVMGTLFKGVLQGVPEDRIEFHEWEHYYAHPYKVTLIDPDIAMIPLVDNHFNSCKSNIKWVEMAAMGIPAVVSNVSPYKEHYNGDNAVMVANTDRAWIDGLLALIEDRILSAKIGGAAQRYVRAHNDIAKEYREWGKAYGALLYG